MQQRVRAEYGDVLSLAGLKKEHLVCPLFVSGQEGGKVGAMPGISIAPAREAAAQVQSVADAGIPSVIVFGIPEMRDERGSAAHDRNGAVQRAVREIRSAFGRSINVITDVCLCQYNLSGHCGVIAGGRVDNDLTLGMLAEIALSHVEAGADVVAPSAMMDGQVRKIREALDSRGFSARILSYSAKHASSLYAPFRSAAFARQGAIDKSQYQVGYANPKQAMREIESDILEGADMVMIKPALAYLDLVSMAKERFDVPVAVQNVSGEYAMIKAAGALGWVDEEEWKVLSAAAMRRAGADRIISYFALDIARYLE